MKLAARDFVPIAIVLALNLLRLDAAVRPHFGERYGRRFQGLPDRVEPQACRAVPRTARSRR